MIRISATAFLRGKNLKEPLCPKWDIGSVNIGTDIKHNTTQPTSNDIVEDCRMTWERVLYN